MYICLFIYYHIIYTYELYIYNIYIYILYIYIYIYTYNIYKKHIRYNYIINTVIKFKKSHEIRAYIALKNIPNVS